MRKDTAEWPKWVFVSHLLQAVAAASNLVTNDQDVLLPLELHNDGFQPDYDVPVRFATCFGELRMADSRLLHLHSPRYR